MEIVQLSGVDPDEEHDGQGLEGEIDHLIRCGIFIAILVVVMF